MLRAFLFTTALSATAALAQSPIIGPMPGYTDLLGAAIWLQCTGPCHAQLEYWVQEKPDSLLRTEVVTSEQDKAHAMEFTMDHVVPGRTYGYRVLLEGKAIDVGEPLVRYAHMRSVEQGKPVHFKQALAEATGFADGQFDCVLSYILFHEVTVPAMKQIVAEMFRVLRPGGTFFIYEFPNNDHDQMPASNRFLVDYDSRNNCEPYSPGFVASDFRGILEQEGFAVEDGPALSNPFLQSLVARKPA
jgi:SAM-dependent methyltransferase